MSPLWPVRGLRDGIVTTPYPARRDSLGPRWRGRIAVSEPASAAAAMQEVCPTGAIRTDGRVAIDRGRCILCGRCVDAFPDTFRFEAVIETASVARSALVVPHDQGTDDDIARQRRALDQRVRRLRRSVHIRHVDTGSDGSDEWEVAALLNPVYDVHRLGIFFTASPRHADILLVTGAGARGMDQPLARTVEAVARPVVVIAAGTDAISGGLFRSTYVTGRDGVTGTLDVDVWVPGSPPSPFALLHGILLALGRMEEAEP